MNKRFSELTVSATDFTNDDVIAIDGETNGTRKMSGSALKSAMKSNTLATADGNAYVVSDGDVVRIKDWATSITSFRTGDVIPVDGPNGTAKMGKDDLLRETAENALDSIHSLNDTATEDDLVAGNYFVLDGSITKKLSADKIVAKKEINDTFYAGYDAVCLFKDAYINASHQEVVVSGTYRMSPFIPVSAGDKIVVKSACPSSVEALMFFSSSSLSDYVNGVYGTYGNQLKEYELIAPANGYVIYQTNQQNYGNAWRQSTIKIERPYKKDKLSLVSMPTSDFNVISNELGFIRFTGNKQASNFYTTIVIENKGYDYIKGRLLVDTMNQNDLVQTAFYKDLPCDSTNLISYVKPARSANGIQTEEYQSEVPQEARYISITMRGFDSKFELYKRVLEFPLGVDNSVNLDAYLHVPYHLNTSKNTIVSGGNSVQIPVSAGSKFIFAPKNRHAAIACLMDGAYSSGNVLKQYVVYKETEIVVPSGAINLFITLFDNYDFTPSLKAIVGKEAEEYASFVKSISEDSRFAFAKENSTDCIELWFSQFDDEIASDSEIIDRMLNFASVSTKRILHIDKNIIVEKPILVPQNTIVYVDNVTIQLADNVDDNVFRGANVVLPELDASNIGYVPDSISPIENIAIVGRGDAIIKAPTIVKKWEGNDMVGDKYGARAMTMVFSYVSGLVICGLQFDGSRCYSIQLEHCDGVNCSYLQFNVRSANSDGVEVRSGCKNVTVSHCVGYFNDDGAVINSAVSDKSLDFYVTPLKYSQNAEDVNNPNEMKIENVVINDFFKTGGSASTVAVYAALGGAVRNVSINKVKTKNFIQGQNFAQVSVKKNSSQVIENLRISDIESYSTVSYDLAYPIVKCDAANETYYVNKVYSKVDGQKLLQLSGNYELYNTECRVSGTFGTDTTLTFTNSKDSSESYSVDVENGTFKINLPGYKIFNITSLSGIVAVSSVDTNYSSVALTL